MAKQTITYKKTTTKQRVKKTGGSTGYVQCNMCHGTGRIKKKKKG